MKEFNYQFLKGLKKGLRQFSNNPINEESLVNLLNAKIKEVGIAPLNEIKRIANDVTISWPFPLVFKGIKYCLICSATSVNSLSISDITEDATVITEDPLLDELDSELLDELGNALTWSNVPASTGLASGDFWDFADFGNYFILTNGSIIVFVDYVTNPAGPAIGSMTSGTAFPRCKTYCNFKGQIIGGNVQTSWYDCDGSSVIWSKIGAADFTPDTSSEAGYKHTNEDSGDVHKVLRLGEAIAVYCDNCIQLMTPAEIKFGFKYILGIGIPSIKAINGSEYEHVFIDKLNRLWRWKAEEKPVKLDYREYIGTLTQANIVISHNKSNNDYYISDGVKTFILTDYGLSETCQLPTSIFQHNGSVYGVYTKSASTTLLLETDILDFGIRGAKTIVALEFGVSHNADLYVQIGWRSSITGTFSYTPTKLVNPNGVVYPRVTGDEFKIKLSSTSYTAFKLDYINIRINLTDKRSVRGRVDVT